ncbi:fasciclin domain-containing protein [Mangrovimonas sp. TPBH4]|uniref:fasciclin domain-containing protein n=1 Tax=Mangrovimonas sp. TPBH4 TaxID=1645914 RepID=UPI0009E6C396|nr:fasciclin domain-containing protein [Mangrovimonas sp. TPBH4]
MKKLFQFATLIFLVVFNTSCSDDDDSNDIPMGPTLNIVQTAAANDDLSSLVSALTVADQNADSDLIGALSGDGPFTVFAPTNAAFSNLLTELDNFNSLSDFDTEEERALLGTILQYHVIAGTAAMSSDLSDGQTITTLQGENITVNIDGGVSISDATSLDANVTLANVEATNGVIHIVDKVLLPQEIIDAINEETLVDIVVGTESLSILEDVVVKVDLVETLNGDGPFTVFAPTNDAFVALLEALGDDYNSLDDFDTDEEIDLLRNIVLYHVLAANVLSTDLSETTVETAFAGNSLDIIPSGGTYVIGDASDVNANITAVDITASNGVAHTIDKVLLPQAAIDFVNSLNTPNIVEIASGEENLSLLVAALVQADAGLVDLLQTDGPFTVFAPTNDAFADLLDALGPDYNSLEDFDTEEEKALLTSVLTYHVVAGAAVYSTDLADGQMVETAQGGMLTVDLDGGVFIIDETGASASVTTADITASNGVIHIVDKVLLPN